MIVGTLLEKGDRELTVRVLNDKVCFYLTEDKRPSDRLTLDIESLPGLIALLKTAEEAVQAEKAAS